ncbi:MAG: hypothetical protein MJY65_03995, partial [Bacteroidaceae bacterium]|nr:hypothetical protein [Bacteroidaceae bacterium]
SMAPDSVLSETDPETWYTNLTETVDPNPAPVAETDYVYAPGWEVLDASLVKKENNGKFESTTERAMDVNSPAGATQDWDTQFWIAVPEAMTPGTSIRYYVDYKASKEIKISTQSHAAPGSYLGNDGIGPIPAPNQWSSPSFGFTTDWQSYMCDYVVSKDNFQSIAFNLSVDRSNSVDYNFKNVYAMLPAPATAENEGWKVIDAQLLKTEYGVCTQEPMANNKGEVDSPAKVANDWDSQLFIALPEPFKAGDKIMFSIDYKASAAVNVPTQAHKTPGNYLSNKGIGPVPAANPWSSPSFDFTTEWQTYQGEYTVESEGFQSIAFNLTKTEEVIYSFKNLSVQVPSTLTGDEEGWEVYDNYYIAKTESTVGPNKLFAQQKATVHSAAGASQDWDSQFFIALPEPAKVGDKYKFTLEYKASQDINIGTQAHKTPGNYLSNKGIGAVAPANPWSSPSFNFTTEWQSFETVYTVESADFQSIAFNLSVDKENDVDFFFNAISVKKVAAAPEPEFNEEDAIEGNMLDSLNAYFNIYEEGDELAWHPWGVNAPSREIVTPGWDNTKAAMAVTNTVKGMAYDSQLALYAWDLNPISYYGFDPGYEYTISFMAKADTAASMVLTLEHDGSPWFGDVCEDVFELSTAWKSFEVTMRPSEYGLSLLMFNIGATATTYYFDHIGITRAYAYDVDENVENNMLQGDDFNFDGLTVGNWKVVDGEAAGELSVMEFPTGDAFNAPGMLQFVPSRFGAVYSSQIYIENEFKKDYTYDFSMMTAYLGQFDFGTVQVSFQPLSKPWYGDLCPQVFQLNAGYFTPISGSVTISGEENTCFVLSLGEVPGTYLFDHVIITETDPSGQIQRPTGIEKNEIESNDVIYNTIGQRVNNPVKGQVYMMNGKKVLY